MKNTILHPQHPTGWPVSLLTALSLAASSLGQVIPAPAGAPAAPPAAPPAASAPAAAGGQISESRFNDATGLLVRGGAVLGANGSGVSGQPADKSLNIDKATAPGAFAVPGGAAPAAIFELTVTAWYKPRAELADADTLFDGFGSALLWDGKINEWVWRVATKSPSNPAAKAWYACGKTPPPATVGQWTFIAMTWKQTGNHADFYLGSTATPAVFTRKVERNDPLDPAKDSGKRAIGNNAAKPERAFNGEIDNVRFFSKALDAASIEKIRAADAANTPVTLP